MLIFSSGNIMAASKGKTPTDYVPAFSVEEGGLGRIEIKTQAIERIGLKTENVTFKKSGPISVPYSSILYDKNGNTWIYVSPETNVFHRFSVEVDYIENNRAVLDMGPSTDMDVVVVGAVELLGIENKIGY